MSPCLKCGIFNTLCLVHIFILLQTIVPITSAPPFPYCGPRVPSETCKQALFIRWGARQPAVLPPKWDWEVTGRADFQVYNDSLSWANVIRRMPGERHDMGWNVEHAHHFYGDLIPLVRNFWVSIFECGGLLFVWIAENQKLLVVNPGVTLDELMVFYSGQAGGGAGPISSRPADKLVVDIGNKFIEMRNWERRVFGRNRWAELKARGGDVHSDLTDDVREP
jgi:hypothetical protein